MAIAPLEGQFPPFKSLPTVIQHFFASAYSDIYMPLALTLTYSNMLPLERFLNDTL